MMASYMKLSVKSTVNLARKWTKEHKTIVIFCVIGVLSVLLAFALGFIFGRLYQPPPLIIE